MCNVCLSKSSQTKKFFTPKGGTKEICNRCFTILHKKLAKLCLEELVETGYIKIKGEMRVCIKCGNQTRKVSKEEWECENCEFVRSSI